MEGVFILPRKVLQRVYKLTTERGFNFQMLLRI